MGTDSKPNVLISKCLEFDACRYNGQVIPNNFVNDLKPHVNFLPVCPELEIGLGVPRDPIRIVSKKGGTKLVQPTTGLDITKKMMSFADNYLNKVTDIDGIILKSRSPSCGVRDAKRFPSMESDMATGRGPGLFAEKVIERLPGIAVEDEGRIRNYRIREHFLTKLFTNMRFRLARKLRSAKALVDFQSRNKLLLMSYNQQEMRQLGRIAANQDKLDIDKVFDQYKTHLQKSLNHIPRSTSNINVLMHALGYFSKELKKSEKAFFLDLLQDYRDKRIPLSAVLTVLRSWITKFEVEYLGNQTYFKPYPKDLNLITDSGKGRNI